LKNDGSNLIDYLEQSWIKQQQQTQSTASNMKNNKQQYQEVKKLRPSA
jgi:hypothetical protein